MEPLKFKKIEKYFTKTELKQRGWNNTMLKTIRPDIITVNPHNYSKKMYLYVQSRIKELEAKMASNK